MARRALLALLLLIAVAVPACDCDNARAPSDRPAAANPDTGFHPGKTTLRHAQKFDVEDRGDYRIVNVRFPLGSEEARYQYALLPRGLPVPDSVGDIPVIRVPVERAVSFSTTHLTPLDQLDVLDRLAGVADFDDLRNRVTNPRVRKLMEKGKVRALAGEFTVDPEVLLTLDPDVVFAYAIDSAGMGTPRMLADTGFPVVMTASFREPTSLARAEWIKFFALFFGKEDRAEEIFTRVEQRYDELVALARTAPDRPSVLLNAAFQGTWYVSGGNTFSSRLIADAGARYIWADDPSDVSRPIDAEVVFAKGADADFWLNPGQHRSIQTLVAQDERFGEFKSVKTCRVYNNNKKVNEDGGIDYYETGAANPHLVLADLIRIFHPDLLPDHELIWHRRLDCPKPEPGTADGSAG